MSASNYENFKSVFGYYSTNVVEDKKRKVDGVLTQLEKAMEGLPELTRQAQMTYHPGKAGNAEEYKSMRERFGTIETLNLDPGNAYAAYDAIEQQANTARATVFACRKPTSAWTGSRRRRPMRSMTWSEISKQISNSGRPVA